MSRLNFKLLAQAQKSEARAATFTTLHGVVNTPIFMPVGTQATVKSQTIHTLKTTGSNVLLANTYHLLLRPGKEVFDKLGGIHRFMNWDKPILTDSGGFQIFSLPHSRKMTEEGAEFKSYVDGKLYFLSPETSIEMQKSIGSDIMMVLDQCIPSTSDFSTAKNAMELTHRWAKRSLLARGDSPQSMFGIVQGACFKDLRKQSTDFLSQLPFDGFAIGGLAVGETKQEREDFTEFSAKLLPSELPRYLMGVGTPIDILEAVHRGVDMFDCIIPSSLAQRGTAFTSIGKLQMRRTVYKLSNEKLDPSCQCETCTNYSRAYLHHLYKADELLGWTLLTQHNLTFYHELMGKIREHILSNTFYDYYIKMKEILALDDNDNPAILQKNKPTKTKLGNFELHEFISGSFSIKHTISSEVMHPLEEPLSEAKALYFGQSNLVEKAKLKPIVLWDVGLGSAMNAMSTILELEASQETFNPITIVSFENDLDAFRLALKHPGKFKHLRHQAPSSLLESGIWTSDIKPITWKLVHGHFEDHFKTAELPDIVYYDPFSTKTNPEMWSLGLFQKLFNHLKNQPCEFYTYTSSTQVRATLLSSGFYVAKGVGSGSRPDTTVALTQNTSHRFDLLKNDWLLRWKKSQNKYPLNISLDQCEQFDKTILNHDQFLNNS